MNKLSSMARKLDTVVKVIYWIAIVGSVLALGMSFSLIYAEATDPNMTVTSLNADFGYLPLRLHFDPLDRDAYYGHAFLMVTVAVIHLPLYCMMLRRVRDILKPLKEQKPFHQTIAKNLKKLPYEKPTLLSWFFQGFIEREGGFWPPSHSPRCFIAKGLPCLLTVSSRSLRWERLF